ncbi:hypothetical protein IWX49DRAFT_580982 [Phyllosticta citricarpa]
MRSSIGGLHCPWACRRGFLLLEMVAMPSDCVVVRRCSLSGNADAPVIQSLRQTLKPPPHPVLTARVTYHSLVPLPSSLTQATPPTPVPAKNKHAYPRRHRPFPNPPFLTTQTHKMAPCAPRTSRNKKITFQGSKRQPPSIDVGLEPTASPWRFTGQCPGSILFGLGGVRATIAPTDQFQLSLLHLHNIFCICIEIAPTAASIAVIESSTLEITFIQSFSLHLKR